MDSKTADKFLKKLLSFQIAHRQNGGTDDDRLGKELSKEVLKLQSKPTHYAVGDLKLSDVKRLFDLTLDVGDFIDIWYGMPGSPADDVWHCKRGSQILSDE